MTGTPLRVAVSLACAAAALASWPASAQRSPRQQEVDVIVVDRNNDPVRDLTAGDFVVREDGVAREVVRVGPAPPPSPIVLLVDNSQVAEPSILDLRRGLANFVDGMAAAEATVQLGLRTFGERPTKVSDPTSAASVRVGIDRIFSRAGTGAYLLEAIVETCRDLSAAGASHPALVAFVVESGPEFSQDDRQRVAGALKQAGATLWTVVVQARASSLPNTPEARERAAVIGDGTVESGGLNFPILSPQTIPQALARIQALFTARHRITYGRPDTLIPPERLEITARREGFRVLAPRWAASQ